MAETVVGGEDDLSSRLVDGYPYRGDGTGRSEPVTIRGIKIRSDSDVSDSGSTGSKDGGSKRKSFFSQPHGTLEYRVMARDTLDSIALSFDSSPSQLMRLNHLTSRMIFPGQVLYVPDPDAEVPLSPVQASPTSTTAPSLVPELPKKLDVPTVSMKPRDVPTVSQAPPSSKKSRSGSGRSFSLRRSFTRDHRDGTATGGRPPLQKAASVPGPGRAVRQKSTEWDSEDSRQYLKLDVKYITDGEGVVSGTMLVTPNAIMFDPNVSDPLVKERGAGPYGVMTNMDMVLGASMYHDISAMSLKTQTSTEEKEKPACPVYIPEKGERRAKDSIQEEPTNNSSAEGKNGIILAQDIRKRLKGYSNDSAEDNRDNHSKDTTQTLNSLSLSNSTGDDRTDGGRTDDTKGEPNVDDRDVAQSHSDNDHAGEVAATDNLKGGDVGTAAEESQSDSQKEQSGEEDQPPSPTSLGYERLQSPTEGEQGTKRVSDETVANELSKKAPKRNGESAGDDGGDGETGEGEEGKDAVDGRTLKRVGSDDSEKSLEPVDREMDERLQEIEMLLNSSDEQMEDACQEKETTGSSELDSAAPAHEGKEENNSHARTGENSDSEVLEANDRTNNAEGCPGQCSTGDTPASSEDQAKPSDKQNFVDFSSGLFVSDCRKCSLVPDLKESIHTQEGSEETLREIQEEGQVMRQLSGEDKLLEDPGSEAPKEEAADAKPNGEVNDNASSAEDSADGGSASKPAGAPVNQPPAREMEYNKTNFREFLPKRAKSYEDPPLYLCLRTKRPMQRTFSTIQDQRARKNKVPEYWFAIPRVKADNLYAFFLQWSPEVYGKEVSPSEAGFVVVRDNEENEELELIEDFFKEPIHKDWEIITREEASKRRMTILECEMNLPLPELIGESTLLCNDYVRKLAKNLPPRTEGYSWVLVFSTSTHGYSLHSLYRNMGGWESPMLLILRDSEGHLFGALTSCALKVSDHYYGTGESFLYRFHEDELEMYRWTGENNFFMKGDVDSICIGGGEGDFGLWLDGDLYHGRSHACKTFGNETLSSKEDFIIADMEAWSFSM
ncbi:oxidation resistance protein 1-like [Diadema antillarum]|uniref:oxidation resistance protein 1-like n=1 Tax=Diadema antillarum TaxID=105358 RepID=UPI003A8C45AE